MEEMYNNLYNYSGKQTVIFGKFNEEQPVPSHCHLKISKHNDQYIVIATELGTNEGMSITNAAEFLATKVAQEFDLDPSKTVFIEHYSDESFENMKSKTEETYNQVTFTWENGEASDPQWRRLPKTELTSFGIL